MSACAFFHKGTFLDLIFFVYHILPPSLPPLTAHLYALLVMKNNLSVSIPSSPGSPTSPPSLTMSSPPSPQRTNTLVITNLPPHFFEPLVQDALRSHFSLYGPLHTWAPLRGFARVIMVYYSEEDAEMAKESNDGIIFGEMANQYVPLVSFAPFPV